MAFTSIVYILLKFRLQLRHYNPKKNPQQWGFFTSLFSYNKIEIDIKKFINSNKPPQSPQNLLELPQTLEVLYYIVKSLPLEKLK